MEPPRKPTWIERVLRTPLPNLAEQAITVMLEHKTPQEISGNQIQEVFALYHVRGNDRRTVARTVWTAALGQYLADDRLSEVELKHLKRLTYILDLGVDDVEAIEGSLIHPKYDKVIAEAVADGTVTPEEKAFLLKLRQDFHLPETVGPEA